MQARTPVGKLPEPELGLELIPKDRYLDAGFARLEWDCMWTRVWNCAGPVSDLVDVGDYFAVELGRESILVVRSAPDEVRAFFNVCQHRGRTLREPGCGHAESFQCPYHLWTYALDGRVSWSPTPTTSRRATRSAPCAFPRSGATSGTAGCG